MTVLAIALGGAVGALLRGAVYRVYSAFEHRDWLQFPHPTAGVNIVGSFVLGYFSGLAVSSGLDDTIAKLIQTGLCGSLTTFSTFSEDSYLMIQEQRWAAMAAHIAVNIIPGLGAAALGLFLGGGI